MVTYCIIFVVGSPPAHIPLVDEEYDETLALAAVRLPKSTEFPCDCIVIY